MIEADDLRKVYGDVVAVADAITEELDAGSLELLRVSPLSSAEIVEGERVAMIAIVPAQAGAWLLLLRLNGTIIALPLVILGLVAAIATVVVAFGSEIALRFRNRQSTQLVYSLGVTLLFVAASLLPETPPNAVAKLALASHKPGTLAKILGDGVAPGAALWVVRRKVTWGLG